MAKLAKSNGTSKKKTGKLTLENPCSAGIDVGSTLMQVCIPPELDENHNREFGTSTAELHEICKWLVSKGITHVAMEATGVYWMPLYNLLCKYGLKAVLLNAMHVKNYAARKTDVNDAEWLMVIMSYNMIRPSFQVDDLSRRLRNLTRHRQSLSSICSDVIRRIQKVLEQMNVKLTEVIDDITGVTGVKIIEAIISGNRSADALADLADPRCRKSREAIKDALVGTWDVELIFMLGQHYNQYKLLRKQISDIDPILEATTTEMSELMIEKNEGILKDVLRSKKKSTRKSNKLAFDLEMLATQIYGVNLMRIDGISNITLLYLLGELGSGFTEKFQDASHFCSWCNLSPHDKISGGKILSSKLKKTSNNVGLILRTAAQTVARKQSPMGDYYRRMKSKGGGKYAVVATAHKMATIIYTMVKNQTEYQGEKVSISDEEWLDKRIKLQEKYLKKLKDMKSNTV